MVPLKVIIFLVLLVIGLLRNTSFGRGGFSYNKKGLGTFAVTIIILLLVFSAVGIVPAGYRGVVLRFGGVTGKVLNEGIYLVTPLAEGVELMNVQTMAYTVSASSASKDLQDVKTEVTLNYAVESTKVARVYQELRQEYLKRVVYPAVQESVKAVTANFEAEKLITERPIVKEKIETYLMERIEKYGIQVQTVSITDFQFSSEFTKAIEAKVTASQYALKAERDLARIKIEATQKIESAKAEAEALRLQRQNVTEDLIALRQIEVQRLALEKWNGVLPVTITSGTPIPFIGVGSK